MKADREFTVILDLGRELIRAGAEVWLVEQWLAKICAAYNFKTKDIQIVSDCIEATVQTHEGTVHTQIREVPSKNYDMERLKNLVELTQEVIKEAPEPEIVDEKLREILKRPGYSKLVMTLAGSLGAASFAMFFNGYRQDVALVGLFVALLMFIKNHLSKAEDNPLILNTMLAYVTEVLIICAMMLGLGRSLSSMTAGLIMIMISGLGVTTGMRDLLHRNVLSGITDFVHSLLGAMGIAIGISLALLTFGEGVLEHIQGQEIVLNQIVQMIGSIGGCIGCAILYNCRGRILLFTGIGAAMTRITYLLMISMAPDQYFPATLVAACVLAFYANVVAFFTKSPPTTFLTMCVYPLLPGNAFYLTVYAIIMNDHASFQMNGRYVFLVCIAIALGYIIIEVLFKYTRVLKMLVRRLSKKYL